jgi:hypothetical protein
MELYSALSAPFEDSDLEWRLQWTNAEKTSGTAVPYVTNRAIQNRLDSVVGIDGWKNEYIPWHSDGKKSSQLCGISVWIAERGEWLTKFDGAEDSDIESVKGGLSDSMKRAAVQWGIGRYLYTMSTVFVEVDSKGKTPKIRQSEYVKLNAEHQKAIAKLFKPNAPQTSPPTTTETPKTTPPQKQDSALYAVIPAVPTKAVPAYTVLNVVKVASVKRKEGDMNLQLRDGGGKTLQAFHVGFDPAIAAGATLVDCEIKQRMKDEVVFNILEKYVIAADDKAA